MCRVNGKNKQAEYKYFVSPPDSFFVWSSDVTDLPLKWKKKCKTAPFRLSFPQAILGSLFQTTSEKDFMFSCSPCLHWLREGSLGLLGVASQGRGPSLPAPGTAAAGPCSHLRGRVGAESTPLYLCWERVVVDPFARSAAPRVSPSSGSWRLILMEVPWMCLQSQWASGNPRETVSLMSVFTQNTSLGI